MKIEQTKLPPGWVWTTMEEIAEVVGGGTPKTNDPTNYEGGTIPWITPADLSGYTAKHIAHGARFITQKGLNDSSAKMMPAGTVLFTSRAPIGYVAIASNPVCTNQGFKSFVLKEGVLPDYVYWWLKGSKDLAESMASGTTFLELSGAKAKQIPIPVAPLDQQKHIVAEIEKQFSRLDEAVANLKRVKANLKRYKAAVLKAAVEGRLVETEAELARREGRNYETGEQLLQHILETRRSQWKGKGKYKDPAAPDTTDLPELPEGWVWGTFGHLCRVQGGFAFKSADYKPRGIPLVRISNLVDGVVQLVEDTVFLPESFLDEHDGFRLEKGDTLIAMSGATTGKMATFSVDAPALLNQRVGRFQPTVPSLSDSGYISLLAMHASGKVLADAYGAAQPNISPTEIETMPVGVPPLTEQNRIVAEVDRRLSLVREVETQVNANLQRAIRLKQAILASEFSGK